MPGFSSRCIQALLNCWEATFRGYQTPRFPGFPKKFWERYCILFTPNVCQIIWQKRRLAKSSRQPPSTPRCRSLSTCARCTWKTWSWNSVSCFFRADFSWRCIIGLFSFAEIIGLVNDMHSCLNQVIEYFSSKQNQSPVENIASNPDKLCFVVKQSVRDAAVGMFIHLFINQWIDYNAIDT